MNIMEKTPPQFIRYISSNQPVYGEVRNARRLKNGKYELDIKSITPIRAYMGKTYEWKIKWPNFNIKEISKAEHAAELIMNS